MEKAKNEKRPFLKKIPLLYVAFFLPYQRHAPRGHPRNAGSDLLYNRSEHIHRQASGFQYACAQHPPI
eukprot:4741117-Amphidinium_carterae.1